MLESHFMNKETAVSYISRKIEQSSTRGTDVWADILAEVTGRTRTELAIHEATRGDVWTTASHLKRDETLFISEKGGILADAYETYTDKSAWYAKIYKSPRLKKQYQRKAKQSERIALGLARAAQKAQDS
jgi:hypothetical protein